MGGLKRGTLNAQADSMRTLYLSTLLAMSVVVLGCEGAVGFAPLNGGGGGGGGPRLLGAPDARGDAGIIGSTPDARATQTDAYTVGAPDAYSAPDARPACVPMCTGRSCGDNGCGGTCGSCSTGQTCSSAGQCTGGGGGGGGTTVTLYGTRSCGYCVRARTFFNSNSVPFADVSTESSAGQQAGFAHVERCGMPGRLSTPTVIIENSTGCHVMLGWGESQVRMYLGL